VTYADVEDTLAAREALSGHKVLHGELGYVHVPSEEEDEARPKDRGFKLRVEVAEQRKRAATSKVGFVSQDQEDDSAEEVEGGKKRKRNDDETEKVGEDHESRIKKRKAERDLTHGAKVIVRNLPWSVKAGEQLGKHFEQYGGVKAAVVPRKNGGLLQGFGFITFKSRKIAQKAIEGGNGIEIDGRKVAVDWAVGRDSWKELQEDGGENNAPEKIDEEIDGIMDSNSDNQDDEDEMDIENEEDDDGDENDDEDEDEDENDVEDHIEDEEDDEHDETTEDRSGTLFIRNLPFTCSDEDLEEAFKQFGAVRYARVVIDHQTGRPRGTGFVCFYNSSDADECARNAPHHTQAKPSQTTKPSNTMSLLQDENLDPSGKYTVEGRILQVTRAVAKNEANRLTEAGVAHRYKRDNDKRRLYLLSEGTINTQSPLWDRLSESERQLREASAKQRKQLIEVNPSLHFSLTRLSIRNIPRSVTSKDLKQLARGAVVGFATDVKAGTRTRLSKEELARGGDEMREAEKQRKESEKGIVKQATIVFESREGGKVEEKSGAGRSRGYGFIEYHTHRNALMGLRWLNGHLVDYKALQKVKKKKDESGDFMEDRKKRLIVEFAIENAQVVQRRKEREEKEKDRNDRRDDSKSDVEHRGRRRDGKDKRNRQSNGNVDDGKKDNHQEIESDDKLAKRQRIIQKKRMMRRAKKTGKPFKA